ncbi:MAG: radical SAM protein [Desulfurococcaceae archaeon]
MIKIIGEFNDGRLIYSIYDDIPVFGYIAIGVIDQGTNVLQVRPTTICPQNCIFCSVDAGVRSIHRWAEYIVNPDLIIKGVKKAIEEKGCNVEVLLDTVGDVLTYPHLSDLVYKLKKTSGVKSVALETHGLLLSRKTIDKLNNAGLDRINLSIETMNPDKAIYLYGTRAYDLKRVIDSAEYAVRETSIDLHVTPLWLPGINDDDLVDVVNWALRIGAGKRWPPVTIQKFIKHKYGRGKDLKEVSWKEFWNFIEKLEIKLGVRLKWSMSEWGMHYAKRIRQVLRRGDLVEVEILARGWLRGEYLGRYSDKSLITVLPSPHVRISPSVKYIARIIEDKDNLYIARIEN